MLTKYCIKNTFKKLLYFKSLFYEKTEIYGLEKLGELVRVNIYCGIAGT